MNSRTKGILGLTSGLSANRSEKSRTNMVSPTRNNQEKQSVSSNARTNELASTSNNTKGNRLISPVIINYQNRENNTFLLQINQKRMVVTKNPSISLKGGEKKPPITSPQGSQSSTTNPKINSNPTAQISLNNINVQDIKKTTSPSQDFNNMNDNNNNNNPLPQLDISGITPNDQKNDNNNSNGGKNAFTFQISTANTSNNNIINNNNNLNNSVANNQVLKKAVSINQPAINNSINMNQLTKSPSKTYGSPASTIQAIKKDQGLLNQNGNLIQSVNLGTAAQSNNPLVMNLINADNSQNNATNMSTRFTAQQTTDLNSPNQAMETSVNFEVLKQFDQKQKSSNIKTFIRVRPLNKMEIEFNENGMGNENLRFPDAKTVSVMPEKNNFTLDKVYPPETIQEQIYEDVGREMVNDVLQGYNGTIFAYGPTGSGKTYTMFGDVNSATNKGIIPRVSNQIFQYINSLDADIEFTITVSMLEIYKEQLFDLLKVDRVGLKIKENPQKGGIYVQGLTTISVDCEEEILDSINLGYQSKQTRETRMNEYSSRSHTIFTINVTQRYPNGQEKIGKLNLVDLAGSEKISKTNATGESLEEAKKINLSLSCLGNVIHALTSNQEHIPYRDSKLTRILQESLGGNYKTSLVAAISPHSSQHEEQISTLKFATRAKTIKNQVKMNVKLSVEQMRKLIEQLKAELEKAQVQNNKFKSIIKKLREELKSNSQSLMQSTRDGKVSEQQQQALQNNLKALEEILNSSEIAEQMDENSNNQQTNGKSNNSKSYEDSELDESAINGQNNINNILSNDPNSEIKIPLSQFSGKRAGSNQKNAQNLQNVQQGTNNAKGQPINLDYKAAYLEKVSQCRNLEKEVMELKRIQLETERNLADVRDEKHKLEYNHTQQITKNDYNRFEIEIMQKQIQSLVDSICKSENSIGALMKEKEEISQKKVEEFLKEKLNFSEIHFSEYFKKSINFNYDNLVQKWSDVQKNMKTIGVDDQELFKSQAEFSILDDERFKNTKRDSNNVSKPVEEQYRGSFIGNLDFNQVSNPYEVLEEIVEFPGQLERFSQQVPISRDLMIILLKKQLFNSHLINQHLARTINALEWKQIIEYGKAKMKSMLNKIQTKHIQKLEQVINEASNNYRQLRNRIEQVELETQFVREKIGTFQDFAPRKSKIVKDNESIRNLLMKPSNDTIRQSLRGSYIGFQLDLDKTIESPIMKDLKEAEEIIQKDLIPLTYDRAIEELKQRNSLIRRSYQELKGNFFNGINQEFIEQVLREKERLEGRINILQNEIKMETSKSEHYAEAYKAEKQNFQLQKDQTKELEAFLVNKMKEESELMERTQKKISDQHENEILKYQQSFSRLSDRFSEFIRINLSKLSEMRKGQGYIQPALVDQLYQEINRIKDQYNKAFNFEGGLNGSESPNSNIGMKFNPNSIIFKSFESGSDGIVFPNSGSATQAMRIDDDNIKKMVENRTSIQTTDEIKEFITQEPAIKLPTTNISNNNNINANTNNLNSKDNTIYNNKTQQHKSPSGNYSMGSTSQASNATFSSYGGVNSLSKGLATKFGNNNNHSSPQNNIGGYQSPSNNIGGYSSPSSYSSTNNAVQNLSKTKLNTNPSSKTNSSGNQGLFGYRKY